MRDDDLSSTGLSLCYHSVVDLETVSQTARALLRPQPQRENRTAPRLLPHAVSSWKLRWLVLRRCDEMDSQVFACLCSALPFTRSLQALYLEADDRMYPWRLSEASSSWLAFAISHPQTKYSTWKKLGLKNCYFSMEANRMIATMWLNQVVLLSIARLAAVMKPGRKPSQPFAADMVEHERLQIARIATGTVVRREPSVMSPRLSVATGADEWLQVGDRRRVGGTACSSLAMDLVGWTNRMHCRRRTGSLKRYPLPVYFSSS